VRALNAASVAMRPVQPARLPTSVKRQRPHKRTTGAWHAHELNSRPQRRVGTLCDLCAGGQDRLMWEGGARCDSSARTRGRRCSRVG
jgi:hypothetical protein